jgi:hypothetical protein
MLHHKHSINPPLNIYKKIALSFIVLTLLLIAVIFYFTLTYAYINVYPKPQEISTPFNFIITSSDNLKNDQEGIFAGQVISQTVSGEKQLATTGTVSLPGSIVGQVRILNNLSKNQTLIATTRLLTADNILYRIKNRVDVPAKGSIVTDVYPDDATKPLAKSGTVFTIPGLDKNLQAYITGEATADFKTGGTVVKAISQTEMNKAADDFASELSKQLVNDDNSGKVSIITNQILEKTFDQKAGDQVDSYKLNLKINVVGVVFDGQTVKDYAAKVLESLVPTDKQLITVDTEALNYKIEKFDLKNKLAQLSGSIKGTTALNEDSPVLDRNNFAKMSFDQIKAYLENFEEIDRVDISSFPSFVKSLPYFQDHIIIRIVK